MAACPPPEQLVRPRTAGRGRSPDLGRAERVPGDAVGDSGYLCPHRLGHVHPLRDGRLAVPGLRGLCQHRRLRRGPRLGQNGATTVAGVVHRAGDRRGGRRDLGPGHAAPVRLLPGGGHPLVQRGLPDLAEQRLDDRGKRRAVQLPLPRRLRVASHLLPAHHHHSHPGVRDCIRDQSPPPQSLGGHRAVDARGARRRGGGRRTGADAQLGGPGHRRGDRRARGEPCSPRCPGRSSPTPSP